MIQPTKRTSHGSRHESVEVILKFIVEITYTDGTVGFRTFDVTWVSLLVEFTLVSSCPIKKVPHGGDGRSSGRTSWNCIYGVGLVDTVLPHTTIETIGPGFGIV